MHAATGHLCGAVRSADGLGHQFFRRVIAEMIDSYEWDWRTYPRWDQIERMITRWKKG